LWNNRDFFYASGLLLPMGYGQGPGQALNFGLTFTGWAEGQGIHFAGSDFGLSIAAMGFIVGSVVGVVYMNMLRRKGKLNRRKADYSETYTLQDYQSDNEIPHAESIDKLTVQICLVLLVYFLVYLLMAGVQQLALGDFGNPRIQKIINILLRAHRKFINRCENVPNVHTYLYRGKI